jgi:hypothetical protein
VFTWSGVQAGVYHREPAALAVPDEIHPAAELLHGLLQHDDVILDGEVGGFVGRRQPIDGVEAIQSGVAKGDHLALVLAVVGACRSRRSTTHDRPAAEARGWAPPL